MSLGEIEELIINMVCSIQKKSGREVSELSEESCPMLDLEGFDSICTVEVEILLEDKLGIEFCEHIFFSNDGRKKYSIEEVARSVMEEMNGQGVE